MRTTGNLRAMPPLPPDAPKLSKVSYALVKFLVFHNRLHGLMSFVAIWWAIWTLMFNEFWLGWQVTSELAAQTYGNPRIISFALLLSGVMGYVSMFWEWKIVRAFCDLLGFASWCTLTLVFLLVDPVFSPGVACYSAFAMAKLISYVTFQIGLDPADLYGRAPDARSE